MTEAARAMFCQVLWELWLHSYHHLHKQFTASQHNSKTTSHAQAKSKERSTSSSTPGRSLSRAAPAQ